MAKYFQHKVTNLLVINKIATIHYLKIGENFKHNTESHNFWEIVFAFEGSVSCNADEKCIILKEGQAIFHKPNEKHSLASASKKSSTVFVANFDSRSPAMRFFENMVTQIGDQERRLLATIIAESEKAFSTPLDDPWSLRLERRENAQDCCEHFIKLSLEWLLLSIMRNSDSTLSLSPVSLIKENTQNEIFNRIVNYMETNIDQPLPLSKICTDNLVSRSYLQKLFRDKTGGGVIEYFNRLKINAAKRMIRESSGNFTDIAFNLGYTSIHYFSRQFKHITGMTLSEYASSVKILTGKK